MPEKVSKWRLREIWNNPHFQAKVLKRCTERVLVKEGLAPPEAQQQKGSLSQVYDLFDNIAGELLRTFHRYKNPDGSLGASGKDDPMFLLVDGIEMCDP